MARRRNESRKHTVTDVEGRRVAGPLNDPLIEAYERLHDRLTKEQDDAGDLYQKNGAESGSKSSRQCN